MSVRVCSQRLLQKLVAIALIKPRLHTGCQRSAAFRSNNGDLSARLHLLVILAHRCFVRTQLRLNLGCLVAGSAIEILVCVSQLIGIEPELGFSNFEIAASTEAVALCFAGFAGEFNCAVMLCTCA